MMTGLRVLADISLAQTFDLCEGGHFLLFVGETESGAPEKPKDMLTATPSRADSPFLSMRPMGRSSFPLWWRAQYEVEHIWNEDAA